MLILRRQRPHQNHRDHEHDRRDGREHNVDPEEHPSPFDPSAVSPLGLEDASALKMPYVTKGPEGPSVRLYAITTTATSRDDAPILADYSKMYSTTSALVC
jgi:hypothetical protein